MSEKVMERQSIIIQLLGVACKRLLGGPDQLPTVDGYVLYKVVDGFGFRAPEQTIELLIEALQPMQQCEECRAGMDDDRQLIGYHRADCSKRGE